MQHDLIPITPIPTPPGDLFGGLIKALTDYAQAAEQGKTEREEIRAKRDVAIEIIQNEQTLLIQYLQNRFGEKAALYTGYFGFLNASLENHDTEAIRLVLESILEVYKDDPCRAGIFRETGANFRRIVQI